MTRYPVHVGSIPAYQLAEMDRINAPYRKERAMADDPGEREAAVCLHCQGSGMVRFDDHFGWVPASPDPVSEPVELNTIAVNMNMLSDPVSEPVEGCKCLFGNGSTVHVEGCPALDAPDPLTYSEEYRRGWYAGRRVAASPDPVSEPVEPHELWQQANGDRARYLELMREHGHIVPGKRAAGQDIFGHPVSEPVEHAWQALTDELGFGYGSVAVPLVVARHRPLIEAALGPVSEPVDGLREAVNAYIAWQYRMKGARRFTLTDLRAALAAAPAEDREVGLTAELVRAALHDAGIGCKPNVVHCHATHRGHATRIIEALAARQSGDPR